MEGKGEGNGANSLFPRWANVRDGELGKQQRGRSLGRHKFLPPKKSAGEKVDEAFLPCVGKVWQFVGLGATNNY